jgi:hypothetical protein
MAGNKRMDYKRGFAPLVGGVEVLTCPFRLRDPQCGGLVTAFCPIRVQIHVNGPISIGW